MSVRYWTVAAVRGSIVGLKSDSMGDRTPLLLGLDLGAYVIELEPEAIGESPPVCPVPPPPPPRHSESTLTVLGHPPSVGVVEVLDDPSSVLLQESLVARVRGLV